MVMAAETKKELAEESATVHQPKCQGRWTNLASRRVPQPHFALRVLNYLTHTLLIFQRDFTKELSKCLSRSLSAEDRKAV